VMPSNHALARQRSVTLDELVQYPLIVPKTGRTRVVLDRLLRDRRNEIQISMELASVETIKKFVGAGLGLSLLSKSYAQAEVAAGLLKLVPLEGVKLHRELGLIYRRDRYLSLPAKVFIETVRASIQQPKNGPQSDKGGARAVPDDNGE